MRQEHAKQEAHMNSDKNDLEWLTDMLGAIVTLGFLPFAWILANALGLL